MVHLGSHPRSREGQWLKGMNESGLERKVGDTTATGRARPSSRRSSRSRPQLLGKNNVTGVSEQSRHFQGRRGWKKMTALEGDTLSRFYFFPSPSLSVSLCLSSDIPARKVRSCPISFTARHSLASSLSLKQLGPCVALAPLTGRRPR